jgi:membrane-associated protein
MLNRKHLQKAHDFFEKYGGKAIILGRFVPIVRTFVPFVAGAGAMTYPKFVLYNIAGAFLWVWVCIGAGWFFGNIPWVRKNFEAVVIGIIVVSVLPVVVEVWLERRRSKLAMSAVAVTAEDKP